MNSTVFVPETNRKSMSVPPGVQVDAHKLKLRAIERWENEGGRLPDRPAAVYGIPSPMQRRPRHQVLG